MTIVEIEFATAQVVVVVIHRRSTAPSRTYGEEWSGRVTIQNNQEGTRG